MWVYVNGVLSKPIYDKDENYVTTFDSWEANNLKTLTWINNYVEHSIGI